MNPSISLYGRAANGLTLQAALAACSTTLQSGGQPAIGLIYSPRKCEFVHLENSELWNSQGPAALDCVVEARVFNQQTEMRWLHQTNGQGRIVLLSEGEIPAACRDKLHEDVSLRAVKTLPQTYLLWGEGIDQSKTGLPQGWRRLTAARIGRIDVPTGEMIGPKNRVKLKVVEYLAEYDSDGNLVQDEANADVSKLHGNVAVAEERLVGLEVA
jgi:CRISPR-associated protein (TIGR03984 family)